MEAQRATILFFNFKQTCWVYRWCARRTPKQRRSELPFWRDWRLDFGRARERFRLNGKWTKSFVLSDPARRWKNSSAAGMRRWIGQKHGADRKTRSRRAATALQIDTTNDPA